MCQNKWLVLCLYSSVDASEALTLPGVRAFISSKDIPGSNATGAAIFDEEVFASDEVNKPNQPTDHMTWNG